MAGLALFRVFSIAHSKTRKYEHNVGQSVTRPEGDGLVSGCGDILMAYRILAPSVPFSCGRLILRRPSCP